jgi:para-nitrobenzyl esterase
MIRPDRRNRFTSRRAASIGLTAFALSVMIERASAQATATAPITIATASGSVTGTAAAGIAAFKGIPYAAPPIGPLRWRAPQPVSPWRQPLSVNDFGASCTQPLPIRGAPAGSKSATVSEDCLTLNIWAPVTHPRPLPVMVWIHGGANTEGTSGRTLYDGTPFARDSVVLVSLNYRLGLFGFYAHPALSREAAGEPTANYGILDQLAAIRWVRRNIAAFGGDTNAITVFGESAGGQDIVALLASPMMRGLVQRAIIESPGGGPLAPPALAAGEAAGTALAARMGLGANATVAELRAVAAATLLPLTDDVMGPVIDGKLLQEAPLVAVANGHFAPIPLIIGTNSDEGSLIAGTAQSAMAIRWFDAATLGQLRTLYASTAPDDATFARDLFRDAYFAEPVRWIASHAVARAPVYLYRFDFVVTPFRASRPGASHGSELPFVFDNWPIPLLIAEDKVIDSGMHGCWVAFAKSGKPDCAGLPGWTAYRPADGRLMLITGAPAMHDNPVGSILDILQRSLQRP